MTAKLNCVVLKHGKRLKNRITKAFINIQNEQKQNSVETGCMAKNI